MSGTMTDAPAPSAVPAGKPYALLALLQLHWFTRLRWIFAAVALLLLVVERLAVPDVSRPRMLWAVVLAVAGINVLWTLVAHLFRRQLANGEENQVATIRSGQLFAGVQIASDLLLLTWILALSGGVENPMSLFYLFHVAISGLLLRTWQAAIQSSWAVVLYAVMCIGQLKGWLTFYPFLPYIGSSDFHTVPEHVTVAVAVIACAVFGTLYFTDRIGKVLDQREGMLSDMNAALHKSQVAIHDLQRRRSRFMQTAAHQLKSPLAMVQTLTNLIRDGVVTDSEGIHTTCDKIVRRCRDGIGQVTELLALARIQEADPRQQRESYSNVGQVVSELCQKHTSVAKEKNIELGCDIPESADLVVRVDQADLSDCIGNLIDNALKYTPEGGRVSIAVMLGRNSSTDDQRLPGPPGEHAAQRSIEDYAFVIVEDTGMGVGPAASSNKDHDSAASIFDAFRRGNAAIAAGIPGTGLGLSIVREVVEQSGGYIHVLSRPGLGSTFTVGLPTRHAGPVEVLDTRSSQIAVVHEPLDESAEPANAREREQSRD